MITITNKISLQPITVSDTKKLFSLMEEIYPPAYQDLWEDKGVWYINEMYNSENIKKELANKNSDYYFVIYKNEIIGNFRIVWNQKTPQFSSKKAVKLHRVYIHPKFFRKGIGQELIKWLTQEAIKKEYNIIWLDVMNCKEKVVTFYKNLGFQYISHTYLPYKLLLPNVRKMSQVYKEV